MVDQLLARSGLDVPRLRIEMELNSFEAIKNAVQAGLGAAFLPVVSIERELIREHVAPSGGGGSSGSATAEADHQPLPVLLSGRRGVSPRCLTGVRQC